jgi:hypothetical protein
LAIEEKRKNPRVHTVNLISYTSLGERGNAVEQGMGKALDIGKGGMLIETQVPIEAEFILLEAVDVNEELIKVKGNVAYSREVKPKLFHTGIHFEETDDRVREIVMKMIKAFLETRKG